MPEFAGLRFASRAQHRHGFEQATGEKSILMTAYSARLPVDDLVLDGSAESRKALTRGLSIERPPQELAVAKRTQERDLGLKIVGNPGKMRAMRAEGFGGYQISS